MLTHCTFVSHHTHVLWRHKSTHSHSTRHCHMCQTQDTSNACRTKQRWQAFDRGETHADVIAKVTCTVPKQCHKLTQSQRIISETHALQIHAIWIRKNYHQLRPAVSEILHTHTTGLEILLTDHDRCFNTHQQHFLTSIVTAMTSRGLEHWRLSSDWHLQTELKLFTNHNYCQCRAQDKESAHAPNENRTCQSQQDWTTWSQQQQHILIDSIAYTT